MDWEDAARESGNPGLICLLGVVGALTGRSESHASSKVSESVRRIDAPRCDGPRVVSPRAEFARLSGPSTCKRSADIRAAQFR